MESIDWRAVGEVALYILSGIGVLMLIPLGNKR